MTVRQQNARLEFALQNMEKLTTDWPCVYPPLLLELSITALQAQAGLEDYLSNFKIVAGTLSGNSGISNGPDYLIKTFSDFILITKPSGGGKGRGQQLCKNDAEKAWTRMKTELSFPCTISVEEATDSVIFHVMDGNKEYQAIFEAEELQHFNILEVTNNIEKQSTKGIEIFARHPPAVKILKGTKEHVYFTALATRKRFIA